MQQIEDLKQEEACSGFPPGAGEYGEEHWGMGGYKTLYEQERKRDTTAGGGDRSSCIYTSFFPPIYQTMKP
jgi:hypothetical protein